ncbi:MAG: type I methionyl aminopeptidase [Bacilli bacterium]|nr:type I methionyl aminopeptidase [Bacilli bacterium]
MIIIKSPREVELMKKAGRVVALVFEKVGPLVKPGVSTKYLNDEAEKVIRGEGAIPTFLGYGGFPGAVCISVNEVMVHGIPSEKIVLKDGDIVSIDVGATLNGYVGDACRTFACGICSERALKMIKVAEECFWNGMTKVKAGVHLGDVEAEIERTAKSYGCNVPRDYTGHGVGTHLHEDPYIPNYGKAGTGPILCEGMTLAIEPMILEGKADVRTLKDGWTTLSKDGKLTSHYENSLVVTKDGYEILTKL